MNSPQTVVQSIFRAHTSVACRGMTKRPLGFLHGVCVYVCDSYVTLHIHLSKPNFGTRRFVPRPLTCSGGVVSTGSRGHRLW